MIWIFLIIVIALSLMFPYVSVPLILIYFLYLFSRKRNIETDKRETEKKDRKTVNNNEIDIAKRQKQPELSWIISVSFGESVSKNFHRALFLAEQSNYFSNYETDDGTIVYQADFNKDNFLNYLDLYKVVSNWKSTFVFINGKRVGKKEISTINRCYGDKLSFNDQCFCFGASIHTENPFGCHRLMITPSQKDWKTYGVRKGNYWIVDKPTIAREIIRRSEHVANCPSFNLERSLKAVQKLPDKLSIEDTYLNY